jgi:hypothetical protein
VERANKIVFRQSLRPCLTSTKANG